LYYRDPGTGNWVAVQSSGAQGAPGPEEVIIQDAQPTPVAGLDIWIDADDPGLSSLAATSYVDAQNALQDTAISGKVSAAGGTVAGALAISAGGLTVAGGLAANGGTTQLGTHPAAPLVAFNVVAQAVSIKGDDPITVGTRTGAAVRVTGVAVPVNAGDVANKTYADSKIVAAAVRPTNTPGTTAPMIWIPTT
jgi:hypothetical protein